MTTIPCPHCEDGILWISRLGGLDPDVSAQLCDACDGTGIFEPECCECRAPATHTWAERGRDFPLCALHHAEYSEDANA